MIVQSFFDIIFGGIQVLLSLVPNAEFDISRLNEVRSALGGVSVVLSNALYFFPVSLTKVLLSIVFGYFLIRIVISIVVRIKSFIPGMGD